MYSVVLLAALTAGSGTPDWHHHGGCWGCYGGCYGCWGGCCGGCYGGFGGCCGGGCSGCMGGCCGGGCSGGCGGCVGGCCGGLGGCLGGGVGTPAYSDGIVPSNVPMMPGTGIYPGTTGVPTGELLGTPTQNKAKGQESKDQSALSSTKATLVIELPANSKLFIDDRLVKVPAGVRSFDTPALAPGQLYYYMVRLEMVRDGKPVSETRRIIVHAGQVVRADFQGLKPETVRTAQAK